MKLRPSLAQTVAISLLPVFTGVAIPFVHIYLLNTSNFLLPLSVHGPFLALLCVVVFAVGFAIQRLVPSRFRVFASSVVLTVGVFAWAEATVLIGDFGFLQGGEMPWAEARYLLFLELILAGILGFTFYRFRGAVLDHAVVITGVLSFSALANLYPVWSAQRTSEPSDVAYTFTPNGVLELSPERNVLLFVIDTFQTDLFAEIIAQTPEWKDRLGGFTYFPDATSAFPKTYASVPDILTGKAFDNSVPFRQYLREAYFGNSLPRGLKQRGFDVRFQSFAWQPYFPDPALVDNLAGIGSREGRAWMQRHERVQLTNLLIFRISPFLAKPWVYNNNRFRIREDMTGSGLEEVPYPLGEEQRQLSAGNQVKDLETHDTMMAYLATDLDRPAFRVFHFRGLHAPLTVDDELNAIGPKPLSRTNVLGQAEGMLRMLTLEFDRLREIGAFDNSTIIVVGDHGAGAYSAVRINRQAIDDLGLDIEGSPDNPSIGLRLIQAGIPLILVKPAHSTGRMKTSTAPVELGDVPNTVFSELGYDDLADGPSMFDIPPGRQRVRMHRYYQFTGWGQDYIVPLSEYRISGFSWDSGSWAPSGRDLNHRALISVDGTLVILGQGGNLDEFEHAGWPDPIPQGRWLRDDAAFIRIPVAASSVPQLLKFRINTVRAPEEAIPVTVSVNGEVIDVIPVSRRTPANVSTVLPPRFLEVDGELEIGIELGIGDRDIDGLIFIELRIMPGDK